MSGLVPKLRFKQDDGSDFPTWKKCKFGIFVEEFKQNSTKHDEYEVLTSARSGLIRQKDYYDNDRITERLNAGFNIIPCNYMTYRSRSDNRRFYFNENNLGITGIISTYYPVFKIKNGINKFFIELLFYHQHKIGQYSVGTSQTVLSINELKKIYFSVPCLPEQQKIADFLSSVDAKIDAVKRKLDAFEHYKKSLMQQIFSQKMRFKQEDGSDFPAWEEKKLGNIFSERSSRGAGSAMLLTVSLNKGVYPADTNERTISTNADRSNYKVVHPNDIAYNSMRMWQGASGVSQYRGIVSPAYTVISPKDNNHPLYWAYYFKYRPVINKFERASQGLTSDTWNLKFPAFSKIVVLAPPVKEQQKIADFLSSVDAKIDAIKSQIEKLEVFKKGLLQQMFV